MELVTSILVVHKRIPHTSSMQLFLLTSMILAIAVPVAKDDGTKVLKKRTFFRNRGYGGYGGYGGGFGGFGGFGRGGYY